MENGRLEDADAPRGLKSVLPGLYFGHFSTIDVMSVSFAQRELDLAVSVLLQTDGSASARLSHLRYPTAVTASFFGPVNCPRRLEQFDRATIQVDFSRSEKTDRT
jgi:hypothetical protein